MRYNSIFEKLCHYSKIFRIMIDPSSSEEESDDEQGKKGPHGSHGTHHSMSSKHHHSNHHIGSTGGLPSVKTHNSNANVTQHGDIYSTNQKQNNLTSNTKSGIGPGINEQHAKNNFDNVPPAVSGTVTESSKQIRSQINKDSNYAYRSTSDSGSVGSTPNKMARLVILF